MPISLLTTSTFPSLPPISANLLFKNPNAQHQSKPQNALSLLKKYVQNGNMEGARKLFDAMPERIPASWTILISGYAQHGPATESLSLLHNMINELSAVNLQPDPFVVSVGLKACAAAGSLTCGRALHCSAVKLSYMDDLFVANALMSMYSTCGLLFYARYVFERVRHPDLVSWSSMLSGFVNNGHEDEAVVLIVEMARSGVLFDSYVLSISLKALSKNSFFKFGIQIHCYIIKMGLDSSFLMNSLVEFYGRIGELEAMRKVFDRMVNKDPVSWNTVVSCHARSLCYGEAIVLFSSLMHGDFFKCDDFTLGSILKAITKLGDLNYGREVHGYVIRAGFGSNSHVISALLDMYIKCSINRDTTPLKLFKHFHSLGAEPDEFIVASILKSCALHQDLGAGKMIHSCTVKLGLEFDPFVSSSLIDMYAKCRDLDASNRLFDAIEKPSTVSWSAIIAAHSLNSEFQEALNLFRKMQLDEVSANEYTYTSAIVACMNHRDLLKGREIHCSVIRSCFDSNASVVNSLINLYLEFNLLEEALKISNLISENEVCWESLIRAIGKAQDHRKILKIFHKIQQTYRHLDNESAFFVLNSCGSLVLLNAGMQAHAYMTKTGLFSNPTTSNSLISMYSKCGTLEDAINAFNELPERNSASWTLIISALVDHCHPSRALKHFMKMIRKGKQPESSTFLSALKACGQMGLIDEAFKIFTSMIKVYKINPSAEIYSCMVEALSFAGMFKEAQHFIECAIPYNSRALAWMILLSSCQNHGNVRIARLAMEKLVQLKASDISTNVLQSSKIDMARASRLSSSWIETRGNVVEFSSDKIIEGKVSFKLMEMGRKMEELGYVNDNCHWLHSLEEQKSYLHTELIALAYGLVSLPQGVPIRVFNSLRMSGDCHSACKLISTFIERDIFIKDSCKFHNFKDGKCSCRDQW